jgi:hypothetical protein
MSTKTFKTIAAMPFEIKVGRFDRKTFRAHCVFPGITGYASTEKQAVLNVLETALNLIAIKIRHIEASAKLTKPVILTEI